MVSRSPKSSIWWAKWMGAGMLLTACGIVLLPVAATQFRSAAMSHRFPIESMAYLAIFVSALVMIGRAESKLRDGIRKGIWEENEISPLRDLFDRRSALAFAFLPGFAWCLIGISQHWSSFWMLICFTFPLQAVMRLRVALRPPVPNSLLDWHKFRPLRSEHWGRASHADTDF